MRLYFITIALATVKGGLRDRLLLAVFLLGLLVVLSVQFLAALSMRQPLEAAISFSLSAVNLTGVLLTLFLGLNLIARELEDRTIYIALAQPVLRSDYILGKFFGLTLLLLGIVVTLGLCCCGGIALVAWQAGDITAVAWPKVAVALITGSMSLILLGSVAILFTSVATSAALPFVLTCAVYAIGQGTHVAKEFVESPMGREQFSPVVRALVNGVYYVFPNFSLFDFKVQAIYNLPLPAPMLCLSLLYGLIYSGIILTLAVWVFEHRDLL